MPPAANIDEVIAFASTDVAEVSYGITDSLFVQNDLWIDGLFAAVTGIFPPSQNAVRNPGQRPVTDWLATNLMAQADIEGPAIGDSGVVGTSAVINAVVRTASAVKFSTINGLTTAPQEAAVVALYNAVWV
jgi:hypothetical protein